MVNFAPNFYGGGGADVVIELPTSDDPQDVALGSDLYAMIAATTAESSELRVTIRRCESSAKPDAEINSVVGLIAVAGVDSPTAGDGSVAWGEAAVIVFLAAGAFKHFRPGEYTLTLEELPTAGGRLHKHSRTLILSRSAGGLR